MLKKHPQRNTRKTYNKGSMASFFTKLDKVKFELPHVLTWGVKKDEYAAGYSIPIVPDKETSTKLNELAKDNDTVALMGDTLRLGSSSLSPKQERELLDKGRSYVLVNFELEGVTTIWDVRHLSFRITRLRKTGCDTPHNDTPPED